MSLANLPVNARRPGPLRGSWLKRRPDSDTEDDEDGTSAKVPRYSWYVTLESESPQPTDEDDESVYSVQAKETDYVADTSDTSTHTWVSGSESGDLSLRVEYEVASLSEGPNPFDDDASSSDVSDIVAMGVLTFCDSDLGLADNSNDSRSSVDSEIGTADYWTCVQCNTKNNNPLFRYCEKCYQIRKNFFPPRPKWRKSRRQIQSTKLSPEGHRSEQILTSVDSGLGSSQDSKCSTPLDLDLDAITVPNSRVTLMSPSLSLSSQESGNRVDPRYSTMSSTSEDDKLVDIDVCPSPTVKNLQNVSKPDTFSTGTRPMDNVDSRSVALRSDSLPTETESSTYRDKIIGGTNSTRGELDKLCITCTAAPKNGAFVHGAVTHICCCYRCAVKVWSKTKRCPICNRKVTNVLKAFYT